MAGRSGERGEDELLILRCQDGDEVAWETLLTRWQRRLWAHAWRLLDEEDAAWDVVQESLVSMARGLRGLDDPSRFPAWAFRIVTRRAADRIRSDQRRRRVEGEAANALTEAQVSRTPAGDVEALQQALARLAPETCALLSLYYLEEMTVKEIAEVFVIPQGTVKSRLYHARQQLRGILENKR